MKGSLPPGITVTATNFPFMTLIGFLHNHNLLRIARNSPCKYLQRWQARNPYSTSLILVSRHFCSKKYVNSRLSAEQPHLSTPVHVVSFGEDKAMLVTATGKRNLKTLDHIIVACHTDNALCVLDAGSGTTSERSAGLRTMSGYIPTRVGVSFSSPLLSGKWWLILRLAS